jgi:hypothetical protein
VRLLTCWKHALHTSRSHRRHIKNVEKREVMQVSELYQREFDTAWSLDMPHVTRVSDSRGLRTISSAFR